MPKSQRTRDLARTLIASEAEASKTGLEVEPATVRVYERLRRRMATPMGIEGFQAIAARALVLARLESPRLHTVRVQADGGLHGLGDLGSQTAADEDGEPGAILIAQLLGLFITFLGESTTLGLIEDLRSQTDRTESTSSPVQTTIDAEADRLAMHAAFQDLLLEIDRLRTISERIEDLANRHPGMEDGLVSVAGNIRNIATVLDVFTLIRSKAGDTDGEYDGDDENSEPSHYLN